MEVSVDESPILFFHKAAYLHDLDQFFAYIFFA